MDKHSLEQQFYESDVINLVFITFKMALYSSAVVMKGFNSSRRLFEAEIITVKPKVGPLLNAVLHICPLTFRNEVLCILGSPFVASAVSP